MTPEITFIDTLVVGAGQAGVAMSEHLTRLDIPHIVLEKNRIAEAWRTGRWDSLVANGPAWHDRFPGMAFSGIGSDGFVPKENIADYMVAYASRFDAPIRTGVEVRRVDRNVGKPGFRIETSAGVFEARHLVVATGPFQCPAIPAIAPQTAELTQMHSAHYRNPAQLGDGAVMIVGAGSSGVQIAEELNRAGKEVYLSVGPHDRPPRSYRGRDFCWWLGVLGMWDKATTEPGKEHVTIAVSGANGGHTVDFRKLAEEGVRLVGRTKRFANGVVEFENDLAQNIVRGDENYLSLLDVADEWVTRNGQDLPEEPQARVIRPAPACMTSPEMRLNLAEKNITTIIWATGFTADYRWLNVNAFDAQGKPQHQRGVSSEPGVYFLGLPWLSRRGSSFIWGVWHDAKYIADQIAIQRHYLAWQKAPTQQKS